MARLTFPTAAEALDRTSVTDEQSGATWLPDDMSVVDRTETAAITLTLTAGKQTLTLGSTPDLMNWTVTADGPGKPGSPVWLPASIVARANRWLQSESHLSAAPSVQRNWRAHSHDLRGRLGNTLPLALGQPMALVRDPSGWTAQPGQAPAAPASMPAPSAAIPAPTPATPHGAAMPVTSPSTPPAAPMLPVLGTPAEFAHPIVMSKKNRKAWKSSRRRATVGGKTKVIAIVGPSGAGKTHAAFALSAEDGMDVFKFDASGVVEAGDWFGTTELNDRGTKFVESDLLLGLTLPGGPRTVLVDEGNRAAMRALNAMLPVLDRSGSFTVPQSGKRVPLNPNVQIVITANIGSRFLAVEPLDEAIRTRVGTWIEVDHLPEDQERQLLLDRVPGLSEFHATCLARLGALSREGADKAGVAPISTRGLLSAAEHIVDGLTPREAIDVAILNGYSAEGEGSSERNKVKQHVTGIVWTEPKAVAPGETPDPQADCTCGHPATEHGMSADGSLVSASSHCRQGDGCTTYDAAGAADDDDTEGF